MQSWLPAAAGDVPQLPRRPSGSHDHARGRQPRRAAEFIAHCGGDFARRFATRARRRRRRSRHRRRPEQNLVPAVSPAG
jgi:hypothetical protein